MINIPLPTGNQFKPAPQQTNPDATQNFISNIGALQDPQGTLERKQSERVIQAMADLKTEGIADLYSEHALNAINEFQDYSMGLYKSRKGFNRLTLDAKQQLDENKKYRELLMNVNNLKGLTADYNATLKQAAADVQKQVMTPENYRAFVAELDKMNKDAKSVRDLPMAHAVYNKYLSQYGVDNEWLKEFDEAMKVPMQQGTKKTTLGKSADGKNINILNYDPWGEAIPVIQNNQRIQSGLMKLFAGDEQKVQEFVQNRYGASGQTMAPNYNTNVFMPGWQKNWQPPYTISPDKKDEVIFTQNKIRGIVLTEPLKDANGKPVVIDGDPVGAGDVIKPVRMKNGQVYVQVLKRGKYEDFSFGDGTSIFVPSPGETALPVDNPIPYSGKIVEMLRNQAGKPLGDGNIDPSGYENIGGRPVSPQPSYKDKKYVFDGTVYSYEELNNFRGPNGERIDIKQAIKEGVIKAKK